MPQIIPILHLQCMPGVRTYLEVEKISQNSHAMSLVSIANSRNFKLTNISGFTVRCDWSHNSESVILYLNQYVHLDTDRWHSGIVLQILPWTELCCMAGHLQCCDRILSSFLSVFFLFIDLLIDWFILFIYFFFEKDFLGVQVHDCTAKIRKLLLCPQLEFLESWVGLSENIYFLHYF